MGYLQIVYVCSRSLTGRGVGLTEVLTGRARSLRDRRADRLPCLVGRLCLTNRIASPRQRLPSVLRCGQVCTRKNCADHYHEAVLNRNRLTVVKGIGRAAEVVSANVYSYPLTAVTSLPMMTVSAGPGFLTADQIQANAGGGDCTSWPRHTTTEHVLPILSHARRGMSGGAPHNPSGLRAYDGGTFASCPLFAFVARCLKSRLVARPRNVGGAVYICFLYMVFFWVLLYPSSLLALFFTFRLFYSHALAPNLSCKVPPLLQPRTGALVPKADHGLHLPSQYFGDVN